MTTKQRIESVLPILYNYEATGQARISHEQSELVAQLVGELFGVYNIARGCQSCMVHWLSQLNAYNSTLPAEQPAVVEEVKASKKPKNCCKTK
jgi:hypothetical protein